MLARDLLPEFELACEFLAHQYKLTGSGELFVAVSESLLETVAKAKTIFASRRDSIWSPIASLARCGSATKRTRPVFHRVGSGSLCTMH